MLNRDDNERASRLIDLISKKQIASSSTLFCLSLAVVLHDYNGVLYD